MWGFELIYNNEKVFSEMPLSKTWIQSVLLWENYCLLLDVYIFLQSATQESLKAVTRCWLKAYKNVSSIYTSKGDLSEFYVNYGTSFMVIFHTELSRLPEIYYQTWVWPHVLLRLGAKHSTVSDGTLHGSNKERCCYYSSLNHMAGTYEIFKIWIEGKIIFFKKNFLYWIFSFSLISFQTENILFKNSLNELYVLYF